VEKDLTLADENSLVSWSFEVVNAKREDNKLKIRLLNPKGEYLARTESTPKSLSLGRMSQVFYNLLGLESSHFEYHTVDFSHVLPGEEDKTLFQMEVVIEDQKVVYRIYHEFEGKKFYLNNKYISLKD
jgi:hypothetical protein